MPKKKKKRVELLCLITSSSTRHMYYGWWTEKSREVTGVMCCSLYKNSNTKDYQMTYKQKWVVCGSLNRRVNTAQRSDNQQGKERNLREQKLKKESLCFFGNTHMKKLQKLLEYFMDDKQWQKIGWHILIMLIDLFQTCQCLASECPWCIR